MKKGKGEKINITPYEVKGAVSEKDYQSLKISGYNL